MMKNKIKRGNLRYSHEKRPFQAFITVVITLCMLFSFLALFITVVNSMKTDNEVAFNIFALPSWENLFDAIAHNFSSAWAEIGPYFFRSVITSLIGSIGAALIGAILAYILVFKDFYFKNAVFMLFIAVMLIPSIIGYPVLLPLMRDTFNLGDSLAGYVIPTIGGCQVGAMFLFRTFFSQQPRAMYESAKMDGANDVYLFCYFTVPLSLPIILYFAVGIFTNMYNDYLWSSLILDSNLTLMPKMLSLVDSNTLQYGSMYAMYCISSVPMIVIAIISAKYFRSGEFASGMKL